MAYDEYLGDRLNQLMNAKKIHFEEKKMFGGMAIMVDGKMCFGIVGENLMARVGPDFYDEALTKKHCVPMDFTGRPMKGYVYISPEGIDTDEELEFWIDKCLAFNPLAKSSKKSKK